MNRKTILLFSLSLLVIVGAFVVPPILLRGSISRSINRSFLTDAATPSLKPSENIIEKLACLTDPETESVSLGMTEDIEHLPSALYEEMDALYTSGAIPRAVYQEVTVSIDAALSEGLLVERYCLIQPAKHLMFEVYVIPLWNNNGGIVFDLTSEKILDIAYHLSDSEVLALELDEAQTVRELQGWADYLDLTPGSISRTELSMDEIIKPEEMQHTTILKEIILTDKAGNSVSFCQTFTFSENADEYYTWEPTP